MLAHAERLPCVCFLTLLPSIFDAAQGLGKTIQTAVFLQVGGGRRGGGRRGPDSHGRRRTRGGDAICPAQFCFSVQSASQPFRSDGKPVPSLLQVARDLGLTTGPVAVVVPLSTFGSWEREMAK